jgi:hypothetical protein
VHYGSVSYERNWYRDKTDTRGAQEHCDTAEDAGYHYPTGIEAEY